MTAWLDDTIGRGVNVHGGRLRPVSSATTVRVRGGEVLVTDRVISGEVCSRSCTRGIEGEHPGPPARVRVPLLASSGLSVPFEASMLEVDAAAGLGAGEANLDLGWRAELRSDEPADHNPSRRLPDQNASVGGDHAVGADVLHVTTLPPLEDEGLDRTPSELGRIRPPTGRWRLRGRFVSHVIPCPHGEREHS